MAGFTSQRAGVLDMAPVGRVISTMGPHSPIAQVARAVNAFASTTVNTGANNIQYMPVIVPEPVTVYQMAIEVGTQNGNVDVGIYDEQLTRLVSAGSTAVGAAGIQVFNVTDTALSPGLYFFGFVTNSGTATFRGISESNLGKLNCAGGMWQSATFPLPSTATLQNTSCTPVAISAYTTADTV